MKIPDGWKLVSADFKAEVGTVELIRGKEFFNAGRKPPELHVLGTGKTFEEALEKANLAAAEAAPLHTTLWEPPAGKWWIGPDNKGWYDEYTEDGIRVGGRERLTKKLVEQAAEESQKRDRLEAFRDQYWPDWEADWEDTNVCKWCVAYHQYKKQFIKVGSLSGTSIGAVYGPQEFAERAVELLSSGELVL